MSNKKNTPFHYMNSNDNSYDLIDVIKDYGLNFNRGNIIKYLCRAGKKTEDELQDLRKAKEYMDREIAHYEKLQDEFIKANKL